MPNPPALKKQSQLVVGELMRLLHSSTPEAVCLDALIANPNLVSQCRVQLPQLRVKAQSPAYREGLERVLTPAFVIYPQPKDRSDAEWTAWWALYVDACGDLPLPAIAQAMRVWVKSREQFLPKPGELRELALKTPTEAAMQYERARRNIAMADARDRERWDGKVRLVAPFVRDTSEVIARTMEQHRAWKAAMAEKYPPKVRSLPPSHGATVPGRAITPQMVALIERRKNSD